MIQALIIPTPDFHVCVVSAAHLLNSLSLQAPAIFFLGYAHPQILESSTYLISITPLSILLTTSHDDQR